MRHNKFGNVPTQIDGHVFHSQKEARRYTELRGLEAGGVIRDLELQPRFRLEVNGEKICTYVADFAYFDIERNAEIVEDVKGVRTETYKLKKRMMLAIHGIEVEEP